MVDKKILQSNRSQSRWLTLISKVKQPHEVLNAAALSVKPLLIIHIFALRMREWPPRQMSNHHRATPLQWRVSTHNLPSTYNLPTPCHLPCACHLSAAFHQLSIYRQSCVCFLHRLQRFLFRSRSNTGVHNTIWRSGLYFYRWRPCIGNQC